MFPRAENIILRRNHHRHHLKTMYGYKINGVITHVMTYIIILVILQLSHELLLTIIIPTTFLYCPTLMGTPPHIAHTVHNTLHSYTATSPHPLLPSPPPYHYVVPLVQLDGEVPVGLHPPGVGGVHDCL